MIIQFKKLHDLYERELDFSKIMLRNFNAKQKTAVVFLLLLYIVTFLVGCNLQWGMLKIVVFLLCAGSYASVFPVIQLFTKRIFDRLEPQVYQGEPIPSRYDRYTMRRILEFNENELKLTCEELAELGKTSRDLYAPESSRYRLTFPYQIISPFLTVITFTIAFFNLSELSNVDKTELMMLGVCTVLAFCSAWLVFRFPYEAFRNATHNRIKRICDILIGLRFKRKN